MLVTLFRRAAGMARLAWLVSRAPFSFLARRAVALLGLSVLASGAAVAEQSAPRQLDIADYRAYLADDHPVRQGMRKFAELVQAGSGGQLQVTVRSDALPGSPAQQLAALQAGAADAPALMLLASTGLAAQLPEFALLDLPFLVRDEQQADALLDGAFGNALLVRLPSTGLVGLAWWENGFRQITTSRGPIRRIEDLRGLNFRVIGEPVFVDTVRAIGANPVPLPFGELHAALKSKRVDAQDNFPSQILAGRLHEVQSALSVTNHSYSPLVLVANASVWNALPAAQQRVLREAAAQAGRAQRAIARDEARAARAELAKHGMAINEVAPSELAKLQVLTAPLRDRHLGRYGDTLRRLYHAETAPSR
jgi:tripartite ATP-independent transporter DctP family solute receptor